MSSSDERNARRDRGRPRVEAAGEREWLWGRHAVLAALGNPLRANLTLLTTPERARDLLPFLAARTPRAGFEHRTEPSNVIGRELPPGASHQGFAMLAARLPEVDLSDLVGDPGGVLVVLDQVTDPQNVGAVIRSAAAFGARGVVLQDRHAPPSSGVVAKAAAGAIERVPVVRAVNLARALDQLADQGWRAVGLAGEAESSLEDVLDGGPVVLVLGSEGDGLRRLVAEHCDVLAHIPMPGGFQSLNVSAAAAVALFAATQDLAGVRARREAR